MGKVKTHGAQATNVLSLDLADESTWQAVPNLQTKTQLSYNIESEISNFWERNSEQAIVPWQQLFSSILLPHT